MSNFKEFQEVIKSVGGIWETENVYFSQLRDGYYADYKPSYPDRTKEDMSLFWDGNEKWTLLAQIGCDGSNWLNRDFSSVEEMKSICR